MTQRTRRRSAEREKGAAAVEFALVLPVLLSLVFGIISFGLLFAQQLSLGNGARQAARFGVVAERPCSDIEMEAQDASATIAMASAKVGVDVRVGQDEAEAKAASSPCTDPNEVPCDDSDPGDKVFVYTSYESPIPVPFVTAEVDLKAVGVFRCEFS